MAHSSNDWFAAIDPVANRSFYGLEVKAEKQFSKIFKVGSTDEPIMSWVEYGGPGSLTEKAENAAVSQKTILEGPIKTVRAATFAGAVTVSYEAAKDVRNRYPRVTQAAGSLGRAVDVTPELLTALDLDRAFNSSYPVSADGKELCATDHSTPGGLTVANELATPAPLDEQAMEDIGVALRTMVGPDGNIMPLTINQWIVPSALAPLIEKLCTSPKTIGSPNNDPSVVRGKYMVFDYLGSSTRYFAQTNTREDGAFWNWLEKPQFLTDQVVLLLQKVYVAFFRAQRGFKEYREFYGSAAS